MNARKLLLLGCPVALAISMQVRAYPIEITTVNIDKIFSINGYDTNDNVELVVSGHLPNACYRLGEGVAEVDIEKKTILLEVKAYLAKKTFCAQVQIPFVEVISVGQLSAGEYTLDSKNSSITQTKINVEPNHSDKIDDVMYAPVEIIDTNAEQNLVLKGRYPRLIRGCMRVTDVRTLVQTNGVTVVKPVVEIFESNECNIDELNGRYNFEVNTDIRLDETKPNLVHVRVLNGKSLNKVYGEN